MGTTLERALAPQDDLVSLRRAIHRRPELGFQEFETARLAAATMRLLGARVRTGMGGTGVIADLGAEGDGPCLGPFAPIWMPCRCRSSMRSTIAPPCQE